MKQHIIHIPFRMLFLLLGLFFSAGAFAQIDVKGHVKDAQGEPVIGATIRVVGSNQALSPILMASFLSKYSREPAFLFRT